MNDEPPEDFGILSASEKVEICNRQVIEAARCLVNFKYSAAACLEPSPPEAGDLVCRYWNNLVDNIRHLDSLN